MSDFLRKISTVLMVIAIFAGGVWLSARAERDVNLPPALELEAYQLCMRSAGTTRCKMTPADFVRYYELKHQLENENGK